MLLSSLVLQLLLMSVRRYLSSWVQLIFSLMKRVGFAAGLTAGFATAAGLLVLSYTPCNLPYSISKVSVKSSGIFTCCSFIEWTVFHLVVRCSDHTHRGKESVWPNRWPLCEFCEAEFFIYNAIWFQISFWHWFEPCLLLWGSPLLRFSPTGFRY